MAVHEVADFGRIVRGYRHAHGLTQEELAELAGISERVIRDLERGSNHVPRKETVRLLADALQLAGAERETFQVAARQMHLPDSLVSLQSLEPEPSPTNLPSHLTVFIGREVETVQLLALLQRPAVRMVTMTGPGGIGKTRLALQVAERLRETFADGVAVVSLAALSDPGLVPTAIALTLGIEERAGQRLLDTLTAVLQSRQLLLALDNFEHLLPGAEVVSQLLVTCPRLQILVTSRSILHLAAEYDYPVPPLAIPDLTHLPDLASLGRYDAIALFLERARAVRPAFTLSGENAEAVVEICSRLDGLPLAIELAAARLRLLPPQDLLERLSQRLHLLTGGARDRPLRHQTLRAAIDWSYSLLAPGEQTLFARLSVFAGGWTLEAAEQVCRCDGEREIDVLDGMTALVEQSLIRQEGEDTPRCVMLETIREFAEERLEDAGDAETRRLHAAYYLAFAEEAASELYGPKRGAWLDRLEREQDNLRKALRWAQQSGETEYGLRLAIALSPFWQARSYVSEGQGWLDAFLAQAGSVAPKLRAAALRAAATLAWAHTDIRRTHGLLEQSLDLVRELGDQRDLAEVLNEIGWVASDLGQASDALEEGLALARALEDRALICSSLYRLVHVKMYQGDVAGALPLTEESLTLARELEEPKAMGLALNGWIWAAGGTADKGRVRALLKESIGLLQRPDIYLDADNREWINGVGVAARCWGEYELARALWQPALALSVRERDRASAGRFGTMLALLEREQGRYSQARELLEQSLSVFQGLADPGGMALALIGLGDLARDQGDAKGTIAFSERSLASFRELGSSFSGFALHNLAMAAWLQGDRPRAERLLAEALTLQLCDEGKLELLLSIGLVALDAEECARARQALSQSLRLDRGGSMTWLTAPCLEGLAGVAVKEAQMPRAARLFGAADALRRRLGTPLMPLHRPLYERHMEAARAALGREQLERFLQEGRTLTREQVVSDALGE